MFLSNMKIASGQVAVLYIIVATGFIADKIGLFTEKTARLCTDLLFYIITPAVIIRSFLDIKYDPQTAKGLFIAMGCGMLMHTISVLINLPLFRRGDKNDDSVLKYGAVFGNCGYMALPLAGAVIGSQGVFYCSAVIMSFQIFSFTYGIYIMSDNLNGKVKFEYKRLFLNPGTISVAIGLPLFLLGVSMPGIIIKPISYVADMNTPFAMIVFGTYLANTDFRTIFKNGRIFLAAFTKLVALPLIMLFTLRLLGISGELLTSLTLSASAPSATNTVIFAAKYNRNTGLAAQTVALVSFISIITMPVMIALSRI